MEAAVSLRHCFTQLADFFLDLVEDGCGLGPVEADPCGLFLKFQRACQGRESDGNAVEEAFPVIFGVVATVDAGLPFQGFLLGLDLLPHSLGHTGAAGFFVPEDVWMSADHLFRDRLDDIAEGEFTSLFGHLRVIDHLKEQVAEFVAQIIQVAARDGVGDLVGFLDRVGSDGREVLLDVPGAASFRVAQGGHDLDQAGNVAGGLHLRMLAFLCAAAKRRFAWMKDFPQFAGHVLAG